MACVPDPPPTKIYEDYQYWYYNFEDKHVWSSFTNNHDIGKEEDRLRRIGNFFLNEESAMRWGREMEKIFAKTMLRRIKKLLKTSKEGR